MQLYLVTGIDPERTRYFTVRARSAIQARDLVAGHHAVSIMEGVEHLQAIGGTTQAVLHHMIVNDKTGEVSSE